MTLSWRQRYRLFGILAMIGLLIGCSTILKPFCGGPPDGPSSTDRGPLDHAMMIYRGGDYVQAVTLFQSLTKADMANDQRRTAQLGEICCRLMLSSTKAELSTAIGMWQKFESSAPPGEIGETLALFAPLITRLSVPDDKPTDDAQIPPAPEDPKTPAKLQPKRPSKNERTTLKKKAAQASQLQRQLDAVVAENKTLKEKIKALEAIDQNIQKKKTEISTPGE